jgi:pimeloyl-ACP methyl ester carboxylesterase
MDGEGSPLILLHGFADSADTWREVMPYLRNAGRSAIALDLPGFGAAPHLDPDSGVLEQVGEFAAAAAERFGNGEGAYLIGNSLGGAAALLGATYTPVRGVVALAPAGFDLGEWIERLHRLPVLAALERVPHVVPQRVLRSIVGQVYRQLAIHEQRLVPHSAVNRFTSHHRDLDTVLGYLRTARRLVPELAHPLAVDGIEAPVLIVWGRQDRMLPWHSAELTRRRLPHARVEILDPCGHCPQVEHPRLVAELLVNETRNALEPWVAPAARSTEGSEPDSRGRVARAS